MTRFTSSGQTRERFTGTAERRLGLSPLLVTPFGDLALGALTSSWTVVVGLDISRSCILDRGLFTTEACSPVHTFLVEADWCVYLLR